MKKQPNSSFIHHGPAAGNRIALTFDDGPTPGVTDVMLDELKRRGLKATFFMIGNKISKVPDLARRVLAEGHTVANHSFTHPTLTELSDAAVTDELRKTQDVMAEVLGHQPVWFRPPCGQFREDQTPLAEALGLRIVMFSVNVRDAALPGEAEIIRRTLENPTAGGIIVCHDFDSQTANALPAILDGLAERGLHPVNLDTLLAG